MARENSRPQKRQQENDGLIKKLICVNRVTKVVKGGRKMRFAALVVVGDGNGRVGCGMGKANEVPEAIEKASAQAKKNMKPVALLGNTIPHGLTAKFGRGQVIMLPAEEGAVMEAVGITNIRTKSHGTNNPINMVKAVLSGLYQLKTAEQVAALRGKTVDEVLNG